jgi:hypothetical protein
MNQQDPSVEVIREVCQQAEPQAVWDVLEEKGIDATPGVVHQAMHEAEAKCTSGLTADDFALLGTLAAKAGGVDRLLRVLAAWNEAGK